MNFSPTSEQQAIVDAFQTGKDLVVEAGAGTGKTSTLKLLADSQPDKQGLYLAYNKAIQTEASDKFPDSCECRTGHSMAYRGILRDRDIDGPALMKRLKAPRVTSRQAVQFLGIPSAGFEIDPEHRLASWIVSRSALETVSRFCNSADDEITERHVPRVRGVEYEDQMGYARYVVPFARKAWEDLQKPHGQLKFNHDHYLKIWALKRPQLDFDYILFDEAQDANPVIARVVEEQDAQKVMVGDSCQAIYGWRGAEDAMTNFDVEHRLMLSQSFRFGEVVADTANKLLGLLEAPLRLSGFDQIDSQLESLEEPDVILCRTNAAVIQYAMQAQKTEKRVAIVGGTGDLQVFVEDAEKLINEESGVRHADLVAFNNWQEVCEYASSDEGADLKIIVKLINEYGCYAILEVCRASVDEKNADIIVSTAHKAKGREWDKVKIAADFRRPQEENIMPSRAELMLMYVSVTRAREVLDYTGIEWIEELINAPA
jgi:hypothetical protein